MMEGEVEVDGEKVPFEVEHSQIAKWRRYRDIAQKNLTAAKDNVEIFEEELALGERKLAEAEKEHGVANSD